MAKKSIKKIISVFAAATIAASQFIISVPSVSAVEMNGSVEAAPMNLELGKETTDAYDVVSKEIQMPSALSGNFKICFDMTVNDRLGEFPLSSGSKDGYFQLTFTGSRVCGYLTLKDYKPAPEGTDGKGSYGLYWTLKSDSELKKDVRIEIGKTYSYEIAYTNVATGLAASAAVTVKDEEGNVLVTSTGLDCRNYSDTSNPAVRNKEAFSKGVLDFRAYDEEETTIAFGNARVITQTPASIKVSVDKAVIEDLYAPGPAKTPKPTGTSDPAATTPASTPAPESTPTVAPIRYKTVENLVLKNVGEVVNDSDNIPKEMTETKGETKYLKDMIKLYVPTAGKTYTLSADTRVGLVYSLKEPVEDVKIDENKLIVGLNAPKESEITLVTALQEDEKVFGEVTFKIVKEEAMVQDVINTTVNNLVISEEGVGDIEGVVGDVSSGKVYSVRKSLKLVQSNDYVDIKWTAFKQENGSWVETDDVIDTATGKIKDEKFTGRIKLLADISSKVESYSGKKSFFINISDVDNLAEDARKELDKEMENYESVSKSFNLPTVLSNGMKVSWTSSNPSVITTKGTVTRQTSGKTVTLTATLENGDTIDYDVYVLAKTTSSNGSSGGSSSGTSKKKGGDSYEFYTPVTTTMVNPVQQPNVNANPNKTNQAQNLGTVNAGQTAFADLGGVEWASEAINKLAEKGIINGKAQNTFAPNDNITRAEFAKILVNALNLTDPNATADGLSDVKAGEWYYSSVASAFTKGVIKGRDDGQFGVNDSISRQDMAVLLFRAAKAANYTLPVLAEEVKFADEGQIDDYAKEAVTALQRAKIINGVSATEFAPKATATRAAAAKMIYGIYNLQ